MPSRDPLDQLADSLRRLFTVPDVIPSAGPGGGPSGEREGPHSRVGATPGMSGKGGRSYPAGDRTSVLGYGGGPDPVRVQEPEERQATIDREIKESITRAKGTRQRDLRRDRLRWMIPYSSEGHLQDDWDNPVGPFGMFDGTTTAPSAGNSLQQVVITLPSASPSPILGLNRYPGAQYCNIYIRSFSFVPLGAAMTGVQELYFTDPGGAVAGLGTFNAANPGQGSFVSVKALLNSPLTDPGQLTIGTLNVNNVGIGGTPVGSRYQLCVSYVFLVPDPYFNDLVAIPPTPAEVAEALRSMEG